ncbi:hypothetical protein AAFC00_003621 [Neodothiora populina]|uniref:RWD domain-containing protein n=1 Tax=Neodothiora populina TaxID=2781224 RepID=A0ABR3PEV8_9PEZI
MSSIHTARSGGREPSIYDSPTFSHDFRIHVDEAVASAGISPAGRDVALASQKGLHIIDLDSPFSPPRHLRHQTPWTPADVQWSPFSSRYYWVVSTSNQRALVWNLEMSTAQAPIEHSLHAHSRAITDINFSNFHPDILSTCAVDAFVHCWDLRTPSRPVISFSDWFAGATQVKWNRQDPHIIASSHDRFLRIWDDRKGAIPLKSIEAHETKIYSVDWNRTEATKLITCSLDRSIKFWDFEASETEPERVIQTPFPVWRARHTPFGECVLAMPQRGNNDLHLYDIRKDHAVYDGGEIAPNYVFTGHQDQAKEFLWRARGTIDNHMDNRDFQLVTWGADRELILHKMGQKQLHAAGFHKGMHVDKPLVLTRRGAPYKTYREYIAPPVPTLVDQNMALNGQGPAQTGTSPGMNKAPVPGAGGWAAGESRMTYSGMETRNAKHQNTDLISWMKGVRFGKHDINPANRHRPNKYSISAEMRKFEMEGLPENLSDEIIHVGEKFSKVTFEEADVSGRRARLSLNGPWTSDGKLVFLQLRVDFPQDYPEASPPDFQLEHTSALPEKKYMEIEHGLRKIAAIYVVHRKGCLEAILSYLLGERDLHQSTDWFTLGDNPLGSQEQEESSSDEEDALLRESGATDSQTLDMEGSLGSNDLSANTNVPIPRTCGATFAPNGRLICFFPPKEEKKSLLQEAVFGEANRLRGGREIFEGFGRLHADSPDLTRGRDSDRGSDSESEDSSSTRSSASDSSTSSGGPDIVPSRFRPPAAWHGAPLRFQRLKPNSTDGSLPTSNSMTRKPMFAKNRTMVALRDVSELLPSKQNLACEYLIFGDGPTMCAHNADVASRHELPLLADIWTLVKLILRNDVPVNLLTSSDGRDKCSIPVLAKRAAVQVKRKDGGFEISLKDLEGIGYLNDLALVKWGLHPLSGTWLIKRLFEYFETSADVQMLAMLSCVFAQFPVGGPLDSTVQKGMASSMQLPAQSLDYFPTREAAFGFGKPSIAVSAMPSAANIHGHTYTSGSTEFRDSDPQTPFPMMGATPPMPLSRGSTQLSSTIQSLSTSPSQHRVSIPSATSSFAASMFARPFNLASSPPNRLRMSGDDLSNSNPSSGATWTSRAKNNIYRSDSTIRNSYTAHGPAEEDDDGSTTEEDEPPMSAQPIKLSLKNQTLFDEESTANVPFLDKDQAHKYVCYRTAYAHMLGVWGLDMQRNEMLKYNGLVSDNGSTDTPAQHQGRDSQTTLTVGRFIDSTPPITISSSYPAEGVSQGPNVYRCCTECQNSNAGVAGGKLTSKCAECKKKSQFMQCTVCLEPIVGLYKVCLACGHAAHAHCYQVWLASFPIGTIPECETGCGCECERLAGERVNLFDSISDDLTQQRRKPSGQDRFEGVLSGWHEAPNPTSYGIHVRRGSVKLHNARRAGLVGEQVPYNRSGHSH